MSKSVVSVKLGASLTSPTKRFLRDLGEAAAIAKYVRTYVEAWCMNQAELAIESQLGGKTGLARIEVRDLLVATGKLSVLVSLKSLYKPVATQFAPALSSAVLSACCRDVVERLNAKMPWDAAGLSDSRYALPDGKIIRLKRWQGILMGRIQRDCWRSLRVPIPAGKNRVSTFTQRPNGAYVLDFPLWSKQSGRKNKRVACKIHVREHRQRGLIRRISQSPLMFRDSEIVRKEKGWFLQLCYEVEVPGISATRKAELLLCAPDEEKYLLMIATEGEKVWKIGRGGKYVAYKDDYLWRKRKVIGLRYSDAARHARDGHGRSVVYTKTRPQQRSARDMRLAFMHTLLSDLVKWCKDHDIGELVYREPSRPLRDASWFARHGIPFDWSAFAGRLVQKLEAVGIKVEIVRENLAGYCERLGVAPKEVFARKPGALTGTEVASIHWQEGSGKRRHDAAPLATAVAERRLATDSGDGGAVAK